MRSFFLFGMRVVLHRQVSQPDLCDRRFLAATLATAADQNVLFPLKAGENRRHFLTRYGMHSTSNRSFG
jgi:hypothetical protein